MIHSKPKPSRITKSGLTWLSPYQLRKLKMLKRIKQGNECADCGKLDPTDLHHIQSKGLGGSRHDDTEQNTKLICRNCHSKYSPQVEWSNGGGKGYRKGKRSDAPRKFSK